MNFKLLSQHLLLLKKTSRTLNLSFSILPPYVRYMLSYGYLIARAMDSVVDETIIDNKLKIQFLNAIKKSIYEKSTKYFPYEFKKDVSVNLTQYHKNLVMQIDDIIEYFKSQLSTHDIRIFNKLISGLVKGMLIDIEGFSDGCISNLKTLDMYASLIGGIPALYWYDVYRRYNPSVFKSNLYSSAYRIGKALQYTNILKDMHEDIKRNRCYIPLNYLEDKGLTLSDLNNPSNISRIRDFIRSVIIICVDYFDESEKFISSIDSSAFTLKLSLIWPIYWAMDTLHLISTSNPLKSKIKISKITLYKTLLKSPALLSNSVFSQGYRFRREILMFSINS